MEKQWFWSDWGVVSRLMVAVGFAVVAGGFMQSALLVIEGGSDNTARLQREVGEVLNYLAPVVADQALVGDYAAIEQILKKQVSRSEVERFLPAFDTAFQTMPVQQHVACRVIELAEGTGTWDERHFRAMQQEPRRNRSAILTDGTDLRRVSEFREHFPKQPL